MSRLVILYLLFSATWGLTASDIVSLPEGLETQWDAVPVENYGGEHDVQVINGLWRFQPGNPDVDVNSSAPDDQWSHMWVPGSWHTRPGWNEEGIVADGDTPLWKRFVSKHREWPVGWFEREIHVPQSWSGRAVYVDFSEISTRAKVWLDGGFCGAIETSHGRVELTKHVRAGQKQTLRVQVLAVPPSEPVLFLQGETAEQIILKPARLSKFGLVWDVELVSEPIGPNLKDLRLTTSVSHETFSIEGAFDQDLVGEHVELSVQVEDLGGNVIKRWPGKTVKLAAEGHFDWSVNWLAERLWDTDDPYLMHARIKASGKGWSDERLVRFGFREFEVRGKEFYLNGSAIRMRPVPPSDMPPIEELWARWISGIKSLGFNLFMTHGSKIPDMIIRAADEQGLLIFAELPEVRDYAVKDTWESNRSAWSKRMAEEVTRNFNHPSIVMWWTGFNVFAHGEDQNPARIGQRDAMMIQNDEWERKIGIGWDAMDLIREEDPTRGVYSHNGSVVGDIQTTNVYLCLLPLQEREEWLSEWAANGEVPFLACEFGLPLDNTFMQGRAGGGWTTLGQGKNAKGAANSAMMLTEYAAIYLGPESYELQTNDYADGIVQSHFEGFIHDRNLGLGGWSSPGVDPLKRLIRSDAYQKIQVLFNKNTFRSWRAWGMTGGVNPWSFTGHTHLERSWRKNSDNMSLGPFKPGTRGVYRPEISETLYYNFMERGWPRLPAGDALIPNNQELLAFIGGDAEQGFTDKDHQFFSGDRIEKQAVFINDKRDAVAFSAEWRVTVDGRVIGSGNLSEQLEPGQNGFKSFAAQLPKVSGDEQVGQIDLTVQAGGETLTDSFQFTVYPLERPDGVIREVTTQMVEVQETQMVEKKLGFWARLWGEEPEVEEVVTTKLVEQEVVVEKPAVPIAADGQQVMLIEGDGTTRAWLENIGSPVSEWDASQELPLVIGRGALENGAADLGALREWVHAGGVLLISSPSPEWAQDVLGLRVTPHPSRRVFTTAQAHEVNAGFTNDDLRDWNGASTTVEAYPEYSSVLKIRGDKPYHGWRWGNRGSVASYMVEKPHHSGWMPIFEGEFDLSYSPLMELPFGRGRVLLSTFDLEDNVALTPAAYRLADRLTKYMAEQRGASQPRGYVAYAGEAKWKRIFGKMGVVMTEDTDAASVIVLGKGHGLADSALQGFLASGKKVLMLRGAELPAFTGWSWDNAAGDFYGTTDVPVWPELQALSTSDFHSRAPYPFWRIHGEGIGGEGMVARYEEGAGVLIATGFDPTWIRADQQPFMRLTAWRHSRNIVSLIAGMGGALELDAQIFNLTPLPTGKLPLAGEWQLKWTDPKPAANSPAEKLVDNGMTGAARGALTETPSEVSGWVSYSVPSDADDADPSQGKVDGEFVIQYTVNVPESWAGESLQLNLGPVDDYDVTFWNGQKIGSTGAEHPTPWSAVRIYSVPQELVQAGENTISIRVMDVFGGSGIGSREHPAMLIRPGDKNLQFYHPDYRRDFAYGDDAYRYYRW